MESYDTNRLVPLNVFDAIAPIECELVYARPKHKDNKFPGLYSPRAKLLWVDEDLAAVALIAAYLASELFSWRLKFLDCLRPVEAQEQMAQYGYHSALVSRPGRGSHPRAMAIDVIATTNNGSEVDMGTPFDYFVDDPTKQDNPAARRYTKGWHNLEELDANIWLNRQRLEYLMRRAAVKCGHIIFPLEAEWWDFRFLESHWGRFEPLRDADLPPYKRLVRINEAALETMDAIYNFKFSEDSRTSSALPEEVSAAINRTYESVSAHLGRREILYMK